MVREHVPLIERLVKALTGELGSRQVHELVAELSAAFSDPSRQRATSLLSSLAGANIHIEGKGNIVGHGNRLIYIEGVSPPELAEALWQLRQWVAEDQVAERQLKLNEKLLAYTTNLGRDPAFANWNQQHYFELQLGRERISFDVRMRLKSSSRDTRPSFQEKYTIGETIKHFQHLVIVGEPGSGKTTALRRLALDLVDIFAENVRQGVQATAEPLPIYIWLPHFNSVGGTTRYDRIVALVGDAFQRQGAVLQPENLAMLLQDYKLLLLLDGFNELGDKNIEPFLDALDVYKTNHSQHLSIMTSRTLYTEFIDKTLPVLELLELDYPHGIDQYIRCYLRFPEQVRQLVRILESNLQVRQLAVNPLLLLMIIMTFQYEKGQIPKSRGQLLDRIAHGLLGEWDLPVAQSHRKYWSEDKCILLQGLGYAMKDEGLELSLPRTIEILQNAVRKRADWFTMGHPHRAPYTAPNESTDWIALVDELERDCILSQTTGPGNIRFWHQTMQEYFAASYIWNELAPLFDQKRALGRLEHKAMTSLKQKFGCYVDNPRWHEVLAIVGGLISVQAGSEDAGSAHRIKVRFIDRIWRRNHLLAAMCLGNVKEFEDAKLAGYVNHFRRTISLWGIGLPKVFPWVLVITLLVPLWLIPEHIFGPLTSLLPRSTSLPDILGRVGVAGLAIVLSSILVVLFFRICAVGLERIDLFVNDRFIWPAILALRHIRNEDAERLLVWFKTRIAGNFSVGEKTRQTIETGMALPVRDEAELVYMLGSEKTRLQAMERLAEIGSVQAVTPLRRLLDEAELDKTTYAGVIRCLVRIVRLQPSWSQSRSELEVLLWDVLLNPKKNFPQRQSAYRGLVDLGVSNIPTPTKRPLEIIQSIVVRWPLILALLAILTLLILGIYLLL